MILGEWFAARLVWVALLVSMLSFAACSSDTRSPGGSPMPAGSDGSGAGGSAGSIDPTAGAGGMAGGGVGGGGAGGTMPIDEPMCEGGLVRCGTACVDTQIDIAHCGGCDAPCTTDMECTMGTCVPICQTRLDCAIGEACSGSGEECTNPSTGRGFGDDESRDTTYGTRPQLDVSATGHAALVWSSDTELRVSRYLLAQDQWTAPLSIHEAMAPYPDAPHVGVDDAGNVIAVWHQGGNDFRDGWANRYDAELEMWLGPERIEPDGDGFADNLRVVMDGAGNATAVWPFYREDGVGMVRSNRYDAASKRWTGDVDLSPQPGPGAGDLTAAADVRGNVMAAWGQQAPGADIIDAFTARYDVASGTWSEPIAIDAHDRGHTNHPNVSADADGNFFVGWHQSDEGTAVHVWVNRYDATYDQWGTAEQLDTATDADGAYWLKLGADHHGNCLAIWQQGSQLMSALYERSTGQWTMLDPASDDVLDEPKLAVDRGGNGIALYRGSDERAYVSRFDAATRTWSEPESVDPVHADRTGDPNIDVDADGRAIATWYGTGMSGSWEVMTNRFE